MLTLCIKSFQVMAANYQNNGMSASAKKLWLVARIVALIQDGRENEEHAYAKSFL